MTSPSYTTDLTAGEITLAESVTGWAALGGGASGLAIGPDLSMQGTNCVDKAVTNSEKGQVFNNGTGITPGANDHFFVWVFLATPGLSAALASRGLAVVAGTATTAYVQFHVEGNDTYGAAGRVGKCYPIRYDNSASGSPPYRTLTGSPGTDPQYFGATANITATVKGSNLGVDAIRRGTGLFVTAGDSGDPATIAGAAAVNDSVANRWGVLTRIVGSIFELQGRLVYGQDSSGTPTAAHVVDSNKTILIVDTPHSLADFTQLIFDHASTVVTMAGIAIEALGTNNRGRVVFNNASTAATLSGWTLVNIGLTTLRAGVTTTGFTWRGCDQIAANGAEVSGAKVSGSTAASALLWDSNHDTNGKLDGTTFTMGAGGHGLELGPNCPSTIGFTDLTFAGYGADGTTDAALYNNSGKAITINRSGGTTLTVRNGSGASTVINASVSLTVEANVSLVGAEIRIYDLDTSPPDYGTELAGTESHGSATYVYSGTSGNVIVIQIMLDGYKEFVQQTTMPAANGTLPIVLAKELNA
jgi:hypothetical protein